VDQLIGYKCECESGYQLNREDKKSCSDIDECIGIYKLGHCEIDLITEGFSLCSQTCDNKQGSYKCGCAEGFTLAADEVSCKPNDEVCSLLIIKHNLFFISLFKQQESYLLLANKHYIRRISIGSN
jgi:hypothetical protein